MNPASANELNRRVVLTANIASWLASPQKCSHPAKANIDDPSQANDLQASNLKESF
jgi:hypothetical protein